VTKYLTFRFGQHVLDGFGGQQGRNRIALVHLGLALDTRGIPGIPTGATRRNSYINTGICVFNDVYIMMFNDV